MTDDLPRPTDHLVEPMLDALRSEDSAHPGAQDPPTVPVAPSPRTSVPLRLALILSTAAALAAAAWRALA